MIHPAVSEPFGMVITEAIKHGVPVLSSDQVGASDLKLDGHHTLSLHETDETWAQVAMLIYNEGPLKPCVKWTWDQLAQLHINRIYPHVKLLDHAST